MLKIYFAPLLLFAVLISSCSVTYFNEVPLKQGVVATKGVTITAMDGSFTYKAGEKFTPNYTNSGWKLPSSSGLKTQHVNIALEKNKGVKVRVDAPGLEEPLYGILEFNKIYENCKGKVPATRSYYILVPDHYIQAALGGTVSVVYETYSCSATKNNAIGTYHYTSWVLWLSDVPFR